MSARLTDRAIGSRLRNASLFDRLRIPIRHRSVFVMAIDRTLFHTLIKMQLFMYFRIHAIVILAKLRGLLSNINQSQQGKPPFIDNEFESSPRWMPFKALHRKT
ncbi:hypothetical protein [Microcoleus sp. herbarium8]|uniref:hypothetical protein n=1 Tax=Microcoleus sp. herbarium8 TaxID=3055436 RepID=UPI002FD2E9BC